MAWTVPITFVAGTVLTAAQLNLYLRDNLTETATGKSTVSGGYFVSTGPGSLAQRTIGHGFQSGSGTTASTTYDDLSDGALPSATVTTGVAAMVFQSANVANNTSGAYSYAAYEISGVSTVAASDSAMLRAYIPAANASAITASTASYVSGLTAGANTFASKYRVNGGTGTFSVRRLIVMSL